MSSWNRSASGVWGIACLLLLLGCGEPTALPDAETADATETPSTPDTAASAAPEPGDVTTPPDPRGVDTLSPPDRPVDVVEDTHSPPDLEPDVAPDEPEPALCQDPFVTEGESLCPSGGCIQSACPSAAPTFEGCATSTGCAMDTCPSDQYCVELATGKFTLTRTPSPDNATGCLSPDVCEPVHLPDGAPCQRDWECQSGLCFGIDCPWPPNAFAFGGFRVCGSSECTGDFVNHLPCAEGERQLVTPDDYCYCVPEDACDQAMGW